MACQSRALGAPRQSSMHIQSACAPFGRGSPESFRGWLRQDSNLGPRDYESPALTAELQAHLHMKNGVSAGTPNSAIDCMLTFSPLCAYFRTMKRPKLQVHEYRHSKTHPYYLDLRAFGQGRKFFKTKAEAEAERLRQITTLARHGREAVGLPSEGLSAIVQAHKTP